MLALNNRFFSYFSDVIGCMWRISKDYRIGFLDVKHKTVWEMLQLFRGGELKLYAVKFETLIHFALETIGLKSGILGPKICLFKLSTSPESCATVHVCINLHHKLFGT